MAYRSANSEITAAILRALRDPIVADAVGVNAAVWGSTSSPRVMVGNKDGYIAGLHRGRLPAMEVFCDTEGWNRDSVDGGTLLTDWVIRVHHNGPTDALAQEATRLGMYAALTMLRSNTDSGLDIGGVETVSPLVPTPLGFMLEAHVLLAHSFAVNDFTAEKTP